MDTIHSTLWLRPGAIKTVGHPARFEQKRQRAAALQDLSEIRAAQEMREASWSAAALCRFCTANAARRFKSHPLRPLPGVFWGFSVWDFFGAWGLDFGICRPVSICG